MADYASNLVARVNTTDGLVLLVLWLLSVAAFVVGLVLVNQKRTVDKKNLLGSSGSDDAPNDMLAENVVAKDWDYKYSPSDRKWLATVMAGGLFGVVANPLTFEYITGPLTGGLFGSPSKGPTAVGIVAHTGVFIALARLGMA